MASFEGLVEVGDDVVGVFDADGESDEGVGDAEGEAFFFGVGVVADESGVCDECFDAAEAGCDEAEFEAVEEAFCLGESAFDVEGDDAAEAGHLFFGDVVVGVAGQAGVVDAFDGGVFFEVLGDGHGGVILGGHA